MADKFTRKSLRRGRDGDSATPFMFAANSPISHRP